MRAIPTIPAFPQHHVGSPVSCRPGTSVRASSGPVLPKKWYRRFPRRQRSGGDDRSGKDRSHETPCPRATVTIPPPECTAPDSTSATATDAAVKPYLWTLMTADPPAVRINPATPVTPSIAASSVRARCPHHCFKLWHTSHSGRAHIFPPQRGPGASRGSDAHHAQGGG